MEQYKINFKDIDIICRICLKEIENGIDIFSYLDTSMGNSMISTIIMECAPVKVLVGDKLPRLICEECNELLNYAVQFRLLCIQSDSTLRQKLIDCEDNIEQKLSIDDIYKTDADSVKDSEITIESHEDKTFINTADDCKEEKISKKFTDSSIELKCLKCFRIFKRKWHFLKHENQCLGTKKKKISEENCKYNLSTAKDKKSAMTPYIVVKDMIRENGNGTYTCIVCLKSFKGKYSAAKHAIIHTDFRYYCPHCDRKYAKTDLLKNHIENVHLKEGNTSVISGINGFNCGICGKLFKKMAMLNFHLFSHSDVRTFKCESCERTFISKRSRDVHSRRHIDQQKIPDYENAFLCSQCGKTYPSKRGLTAHEHTHKPKNVKRLTCDICNKTYGTHQSLNYHRLQHMGEKPFSCHICQNKFRQITHLNRHIKIMHQRMKPYLCTFCNKKFSVSGNLKIHIRIHTGEKPFVCSYCEKGFYESRGLKKHKCPKQKKDETKE